MKVLIVDDSTFSQKITASLLKDQLPGAELFYAADGEEGLDLYRSLSPDFVIADLLMPKLSGNEMVQFIKGYDPDAKIIILSADVQKYVKAEMENYDILTFVNKPFNQEKAGMVAALIKENSHE